MPITTPFRIEPPLSATPDRTRPIGRRLVGGWLFNEGTGRTIHDASGRHHPGDFSGAPRWSSGTFGRTVAFDGNDDWISMGNSLNLGTDDVSVFALVRYAAVAQPDEWNNIHIGAIAGKGYLDGSGKGYGLAAYEGNTIAWQLRDQATAAMITSDSALNDGRYHAVVGVGDRDSSTGLRLYIDGVRQAATGDLTTLEGHDLTGSRAFAVGSRQEEGGSWYWDFQGAVACLYVWKRVLTDNEIRQLHVNPFIPFTRRRPLALACGPVGNVVDLAGVVNATSVLSGTLRRTLDLSGVCTATATLTGTLSDTGVAPLSGTLAAASALTGLLRVSSALPWFGATLQTETPWTREALSHGMTAQAFALGTALTGGWFWVRRAGCTALYRGPDSRQVDFSNALCVADIEAHTITAPDYLWHAPNSRHCYVVRRFNACGYAERTTGAAVQVVVGPDGKLMPPAPNAIGDLSIEASAGNRATLLWFYSPLEEAIAPDAFRIYWDAGSGRFNFQTPLATVPYAGRKFYRYRSAALAEGRYRFTVAAVSAAGIESRLHPGLGCHVGGPEPAAIDILSCETV